MSRATSSRGPTDPCPPSPPWSQKGCSQRLPCRLRTRLRSGLRVGGGWLVSGGSWSRLTLCYRAGPVDWLELVPTRGLDDDTETPRVAASPCSCSFPRTGQGAALPSLPDTVQLCRGTWPWKVWPLSHRGPGSCAHCWGAGTSGTESPGPNSWGEMHPVSGPEQMWGLGRAAGTKAPEYCGLQAPWEQTPGEFRRAAPAEPLKPWQHGTHVCEPALPGSDSFPVEAAGGQRTSQEQATAGTC